uniref:distal membrane-arm assembly complex protein 2 isoform X2 n=1 Tax=Podarcis muralis TaxID=64176 RepID=UPI0010A04568|nr:distal membrane-arm assembly complex protein 2 isoform X2 [Podarcis muralis]
MTFPYSLKCPYRMSHDLSKMAAPMLFQHSRGFVSLCYTSLRYRSKSTFPTPGPVKSKFLQYLCDRFYDIETIVDFGKRLRLWNAQRKNRYNIQAKNYFGENIAAAVFVLALKGSIRLRGKTEWEDQKGGLVFLQDKDTCLEGANLSGSIINYDGLDNLVNQRNLKQLDLSRCPYIDDWSLSRLHNFADTLQELSLAGCPQVTERGLACLHQLENLRFLDVSDLPSVRHKELVRILLEEMLPQCHIVGMNYPEGVGLPLDSDKQGGEIEEEHQGGAGSQEKREVSI